MQQIWKFNPAKSAAMAFLIFGLSGCSSEKSVEYYGANVPEANKVLNDCVLKKGLESVKTDANCSNAFQALQKAEKEQRAVQRKADERALQNFGNQAPAK